jgi:hypothetical protein
MDASASACADATVDSCAHTLKAPLTLSNYGRQLQKQSGFRQSYPTGCKNRICGSSQHRRGTLPDAGRRFGVKSRRRPFLHTGENIRPNRPNFIWKGSTIRETAISNQQEFSGV